MRIKGFNTIGLNSTKPLHIEKVEESVCFQLPAEIKEYELLAALSAIHWYKQNAFVKADAWSSMRPGYKKELTLFIDIVCPNPRFTEAVNWLLNPRNLCYSTVGIHTDNYAMFCDLSAGFHYKQFSKIHAASAFGVVAGCEAKSMFPIPETKDVYEPADIIVACNGPQDEMIWEFLGKEAAKSANLKVAKADTGNMNVAQLAALCRSAKIYIDKLSLGTYVASCLGIGVLEIYPTHEAMGWLSKWSNPFYGMYVADAIGEDDLPKLARAAGHIWRRMILRQLSKQPAASASAVAAT